MTYRCQYCQRDFVRENTLAVHLCEPRRRRQEQNERGVQLGFQAYLRFYEITQGSARLKTFDDFADSSYYRAFVDRKSTRLNSSHIPLSRMPSSA